MREEWEKREELERLQEEQKLLLEQEREKRKEFEIKQREKENQLLGKICKIIFLLNFVYTCKMFCSKFVKLCMVIKEVYK